MAFNTLEKKALTGLALLYASRMLGLFMVVPVLTLYGQSLTGATTVMLGVALGIYGITQAVLQIPLGMLSDRFGRKPVIAAGLLVFFIGSLIAALSDNVWGVVAGRALQGAGAIASVILALLADYTRPEERTKAMAIVGAIIGGSFVLAVIVGPVIAGVFGLSGVFWATTLMALGGLAIVYWLPAPPVAQVHEERRWRGSLLGKIARDRRLVPLNLGVFALHLTMTMLFVGLPLSLVEQGIASDQLGWVYGPVMVLSFLGMVPMIAVAERRKAHRTLLILAGLFIVLALLALGGSAEAWISIGTVWLFFVGFNFIEASLPSLISRRAPQQARGTAMGVFSTGQFLGAAVGGICGGWAYQVWGMPGISFIGTAVISLWIMLLWRLEQEGFRRDAPEPPGTDEDRRNSEHSGAGSEP